MSAHFWTIEYPSG